MNYLLAFLVVASCVHRALGDGTCVSSEAAGAEFAFDGFVPFLEPFAGDPFVNLLLDANTATVPLPPDEVTTTFAPSNAAIAEVADVLSELPVDALTAVLFNSVLLDLVPSDNLLEGFEGQEPGNSVTVTLTNSLGTDLEFTTSDGDLFVTDPGTGITAKVIQTDIDVCAGIIHVIDSVLIPAAAPVGGYGEEDGVYGN